MEGRASFSCFDVNILFWCFSFRDLDKMDTLDNIRAFLISVRLGSFSAAARDIGTTPSVVAKRVDQLEYRLGHTLLRRSTRKLDLTEDGARLLPRCLTLLAEFDEMAADRGRNTLLEGKISMRIAGPAAALLLAPIVASFLEQHPAIELDIQHSNLLTNPLEDRCDIAIGMRSQSYQSILDVALAPYPRVACASPAYLESFGHPGHPRELALHHCLGQSSTGFEWRFSGPTGEVMVPVRPQISSNSSIYLREAALHGLGIAILPHFLIAEDLKAGRLVDIFRNHAPIEMWLKALVPEHRAREPLIAKMLEHLMLTLKTFRA